MDRILDKQTVQDRKIVVFENKYGGKGFLKSCHMGLQLFSFSWF